MTGRLRLGAQVVAVGVVAALLGLLVWKVAKGTEQRRHGHARSRRHPGRARVLARAARPRRRARARLAAGQGRRPQLLGLVVRAVPRGDAAARGGLAALAGQERRLRRRERQGLPRRRPRLHAPVRVTYPTVYDGKGSTVGRYGVTGFPETYFVDARGPRRLPHRRRSPRAGGARRGHRAGARAGSHEAAPRPRPPRARGRGTGGASEERPTPAELESELVCPVCETTLDTSNAPDRAADEGEDPRADRGRRDEERDQGRVRRPVRARCARGAAEARLRPPGVAAAARRVSRSAPSSSACSRGAGAIDRGEEPAPPLDPELEHRLDAELARFE